MILDFSIAVFGVFTSCCMAWLRRKLDELVDTATTFIPQGVVS